ncbi:DoxX family protein [Rathayibacter soli]|uniref:DoxX family protein n=1 Tax=Rathayibacter soli TaxID=3144168 RepID=UPI0027E4A62E|nr:MauE/DoxX family redox-associated membrane protein [Glaciibacter superstes]
MLGTFAIALPLTMAIVMIASGIGKLRHPDDLSGWQQLGIPAALRQRWLLRLHPWGELALGVALAVLGGVLGVLAALICVLLMAAYTWVVIIALRRPEAAECACFGARKPVTRVTAVRNTWLTLVSAAAAAVIWTTPLFGGAVAAGVGEWAWVAAAVVAIITAVLIVWPAPGSAGPSVAQAALPRPAMALEMPDENGVIDYVRTRTPAVPVTLADGATVNLRALTSSKPLLLMAVSDTCGACEEVIARIGHYRETLPEVDVRVLVKDSPEHSTLTDTSEPQSLHDPNGYVRESIADWPVPTAVLLGIDGMLAGGPESGPTNVETFVGDIYESLHGTRPTESTS